MTQKELSYLEDAIGHEDNIIKICEEMINYLQDKSLIKFIDNEIKNHAILKKKIMGLMEAKANE